jgi:hypothetical protein
VQITEGSGVRQLLGIFNKEVHAIAATRPAIASGLRHASEMTVLSPQYDLIAATGARLLSLSRFAAPADHDCNEIAEEATSEHAHEELDRW